MKQLTILLILFVTAILGVTLGAASGGSTLGTTLEAASAVRFNFVDWRANAQTVYEYAQMRNGSWWSFRDRDGLTGPAAVNIREWAQAIIDLQTESDLLIHIPEGLDLDDSDDTPTTVGHTPLLFCAEMLFDVGSILRVCIDETADRKKTYANIWNTLFHEAGWYEIDGAQAEAIFDYLPTN